MGPLTFKALRLLADGHFHSGADIARRLERSRAAVSETLKGARDLGVEVFSVPGLFIAGAAAFPTSSFANPTLTLVALSLRLADHLQRAPVRPAVTIRKDAGAVHA